MSRHRTDAAANSCVTPIVTMARSLVMFQSLLSVAPQQPVCRPTPISLLRASPPYVKQESPLAPSLPDVAASSLLRAARSSTASSPSSSSPSDSRLWRCDLGCGQRYERSSGRSIRRHVLACFRLHWPGAVGVSVSRLHELISEQQEAGVLDTGLRRWKMRQPPRKAEQLEAEARWECPARCGKRYRNTSTRSISRHKATCACRAQQQQDEQQEQEGVPNDARSASEARDAGDEERDRKLRIRGRGQPEKEDAAIKATAQQHEEMQQAEAEPPWRRYRRQRSGDSEDPALVYRSPSATEEGSSSHSRGSLSSTPPSSSSPSPFPAAFAPCFSSMSSARTSGDRPAFSSSEAAQHSTEQQAADVLWRSAGIAREEQSRRQPLSPSASALAASLCQQHQEVAALYHVKEQQRLPGLQMQRLVQQIAANYGTQQIPSSAAAVTVTR